MTSHYKVCAVWCNMQPLHMLRTWTPSQRVSITELMGNVVLLLQVYEDPFIGETKVGPEAEQ
jgi:hypothetical protein